jgi:hypothetical protein
MNTFPLLSTKQRRKGDHSNETNRAQKPYDITIARTFKRPFNFVELIRTRMGTMHGYTREDHRL